MHVAGVGKKLRRFTGSEINVGSCSDCYIL